MSGRYFYLQSALNDMVLDVPRSDASPGNRVKMWSHNGNDNQLWYEDVIYGTIRTKLDDNFVLDMDDDNRLVVNEFDPDAPNQKWFFADDRIENKESGQVLDIAKKDDSEGAEICMWDWSGGDHQTFSINYEDPKEFIIISKLNGKAMDVRRACTDAGTEVIMYDNNGKDNQVWYESKEGIIHTKLNDYVLSSEDGTFQIQPYDGSAERQWIRLGDKIVNKEEPDLLADIKRANDENGANIGPWKDNGQDHQLWEYEWL